MLTAMYKKQSSKECSPTNKHLGLLLHAGTQDLCKQLECLLLSTCLSTWLIRTHL